MFVEYHQNIKSDMLQNSEVGGPVDIYDTESSLSEIPLL